LNGENSRDKTQNVRENSSQVFVASVGFQMTIVAA
jgi:hypothetical protein